MIWFTTTDAPPPGGYFFAINGEEVSAPTFVEMEYKMRPLLKKYGVKTSLESVLAEYMCPKLPKRDSSWLCTGKFASETVTARVALKNSEPYTRGPFVSFDEIQQRLRTCMKCPKHSREFCLSCTGHQTRMEQMMGPGRPALPEDRGTGICMCAKAYEMALASKDYGVDEPVWDGAPQECWRKTSV